jgi:hypothetical protein
MFQIKLAATLLAPLALYSVVACAQDQQQPTTISKNTTPTQLKMIKPQSTDIILEAGADPSPTEEASASSSAYVRPVPVPRAPKKPFTVRPFRSAAVSVKVNTLGGSAELATPISRTLNLRSSFSFVAFNYPFSIDGVRYDARLHLRSSGTTLDWFPFRGGFHISPGMLYAKNTLSAPASVNPGQNFELGSQPFVNSVDDPVHGTSAVVFPHSIAPMLVVGLSNIIPRSGRHLSVPFEIGAAYTGAPQINVTLSGTACTTQGCVSFADNKEAQESLKQEVHNLNENLKRVPVYPILSLGLAYRF